MSGQGPGGVGGPGPRGVEPRRPSSPADRPRPNEEPSEFEQLLQGSQAAGDGESTAKAPPKPSTTGQRAGGSGTSSRGARDGAVAAGALGADAAAAGLSGAVTLPQGDEASAPGGLARDLLAATGARGSGPKGSPRSGPAQGPGGPGRLPAGSLAAAGSAASDTPLGAATPGALRIPGAGSPLADAFQAHTLVADVATTAASPGLPHLAGGAPAVEARPRRRQGELDPLDLAHLGGPGDGTVAAFDRLAPAIPTLEGRPTSEVPVTQLADQLIEAVRVANVGERSTVDLRLDLGRLGSANVELARGADGALTIRFALADAPAASDVGRQAEQLLAALSERGLGAVRIEVSTADGQLHAALEGGAAKEAASGQQPAAVTQLAQAEQHELGRQPHHQDERQRQRPPAPPDEDEELG